MDAVTICAVNYLPFANTLGNSFLATNPNSSFSIFVVDAKKNLFQKLSQFNYFTPDDLDISSNQFENMAFYYNVTELSTALKPSVLKLLFRNGTKKAIYLDPDIQVFSELIELDEALDSNQIVLTPHTLNPMPRDGLRPSEADILGSGTFNLGFIGLSKGSITDDFLDWWEQRLKFDSISDPEEMLFTDQRWIDLVPSYFSFHVLREPGYNVAYWNLHERELTDLADKVFVTNQELRFFHFSGYRPERPWILSKYVSDNPRIGVSDNNTLSELCKNYGELAKRNGWLNESTINYGYENFQSGKFIPSSLRRLYREDCIEADKSGATLDPPSDWQSWATQRTVESGNLSRILFSIWKSRPDLKRRYPDATGTEAEELQNWARTHGVEERVIDIDLCNIGSLQNDAYPIRKTKKDGISIAGYLHGELGLGQSARLVYQSALQTGLPISTLNSNRSQSRQSEKIAESNNDFIFPIIISIVNADHFKFWIKDIGAENLRHANVIGVWAWETEDFPLHMHDAFEYVNEVWAVSEFVKEAIQKHTKKPVKVFPTPIIAPKNIEVLNRNAIGIAENQKYNLFIFDYMSVFNRKNPLAVVESHTKAFPDADGPYLVIKSTNGVKDPENRELLKFKTKHRSDIILFEDYLSREQLTSLINECEVYISLHRSEGYGLTMAEAMSLGKPVVATGYSGNLDFMNSKNSILVPFKKVLVGTGSFPYAQDSWWAEPDINYASAKLVELSKNSELRNSLGIAARNYVLQSFSIENAADFISQRVTYQKSIVVRLKQIYSQSIVAIKQIKTKAKKIIKVIIES